MPTSPVSRREGESDDPTPPIGAPKLERWESRTEWPLATIALIFLAAYSIRVLAEPQGHAETALQIVIWTTYAVFVVDYFARLYLATNRRRWFLRHLADLAIVLLPLLRPPATFKARRARRCVAESHRRSHPWARHCIHRK